MKQSAGLLLYRYKEGVLQFFLVHPGGPFFARKDEGYWTVPKGEILEGEEPLNAAQRELGEETGFTVTGNFIELVSIQQKGGKIVRCWAIEGDVDLQKNIESNTFEIEWPPKSGLTRSFPEIDKAGWFSLEEAEKLINVRQRAFLIETLTLTQ